MNSEHYTNFKDQKQLIVEYSVIPSIGSNLIPRINEILKDKSTKKIVGEYSINLTKHSYKRAKNRGFSFKDLLSVLDFGETIYKQGLIFHFIMNRTLPNSIDKYLIDRIKNMVVVTNRSETEIITCYRANNSFINLRKKSKTLW